MGTIHRPRHTHTHTDLYSEFPFSFKNDLFTSEFGRRASLNALTLCIVKQSEVFFFLCVLLSACVCHRNTRICNPKFALFSIRRMYTVNENETLKKKHKSIECGLFGDCEEMEWAFCGYKSGAVTWRILEQWNSRIQSLLRVAYIWSYTTCKVRVSN